MAPVTRSQARSLAAAQASSSTQGVEAGTLRSGKKRALEEPELLGRRTRPRQAQQSAPPREKLRLTDLPTELTRQIASHLPMRSQLNLGLVNRKLDADLGEHTGSARLTLTSYRLQTADDVLAHVQRLPPNIALRMAPLERMVSRALELPVSEQSDAIGHLRTALGAISPSDRQHVAPEVLQGLVDTASRVRTLEGHQLLHDFVARLHPEQRAGLVETLGHRLHALHLNHPDDVEPAAALFLNACGSLPPAACATLAPLQRAALLGVQALQGLDNVRTHDTAHAAIRQALDSGQPVDEVARAHGIVAPHNLIQLSAWSVAGAAGQAVAQGESVQAVFDRFKLHDFMGDPVNRRQLERIAISGAPSDAIRQALSSPQSSVTAVAAQRGITLPEHLIELSRLAVQGGAGQAVLAGEPVNAVAQRFGLVDGIIPANLRALETLCVHGPAAHALAQGERIDQIVGRFGLTGEARFSLELNAVLGVAGARIQKGELAESVIDSCAIDHPGHRHSLVLLQQAYEQRRLPR